MWLSIAVGVVILAMLYARFVRAGDAGSYISEPIVRADLQIHLIGTGTLEPSVTRTVNAPPTGLVNEVLVHRGDRVVKGQLLAKLDPQPLRDALDRAEHLRDERATALFRAQEAVRRLRQQLRLFEQARRRPERLVASGRAIALTRADLVHAENVVKTSQTEVEAALADVANRKDQLTAAEIRSPLNGVVLQRHVNSGDIFAPSPAAQPLFVIGVCSRLVLDIHLNEQQASLLHPGMTAQLAVPHFPRRFFSGKLQRIGAPHRLPLGSESPSQPRVQPVSRDRRLTIGILNTGGLLLPGMAASAEFDLGMHSNVLVVSNAALEFARLSDGELQATRGSAVYVLDSDGRPHRVPVTEGGGDGARTELVSGALSPGARIIRGLR